VERFPSLCRTGKGGIKGGGTTKNSREKEEKNQKGRSYLFAIRKKGAMAEFPGETANWVPFVSGRKLDYLFNRRKPWDAGGGKCSEDVRQKSVPNSVSK